MRKIKISLTDKFIILFIAMGVIAAGLVSSITYFLAKDALMSRTFDQLTSVKSVKKRQIENFFKEREKDIQILVNILSHSSHPTFKKENALINEFFDNNDTYSNYFLFEDDRIILSSTEDTTLYTRFNITNKLKSATITEILNKGFQNGISIIIAAPIQKGKKLVAEINLDEINKIMLETNPGTGLGESGESYIVGSDFLMRTNSRFQKNTIMNLMVNTVGVNKAFQNQSNTDVIFDYRGINVLSSFCKLDIAGLNWALLAEIDLNEALAPIETIRNYMLFLTVSISLIVFIIAYVISKQILKPLNSLADASKQIGEGNYDVILESKTGDEIGELTESFNLMSKQLKDKNIELNNERLQRYSIGTDAQEQERERLSRDLHDGIGQTFIAVKLKIEQLKSTSKIDSKLFDDIDYSLNSAIDEIRKISNDLMPTVLKEFGIERAVQKLCEQINDYGILKVIYNCNFPQGITNKRTNIYLFRIIQEALNNILKHSQAEKAKIDIFEENGLLRIQISDNGIGFDLKEIKDSKGAGLYNIQERTNILNGNVEISSELGTGVVIDISIPIEKLD